MLLYFAFGWTTINIRFLISFHNDFSAEFGCYGVDGKSWAMGS